MDSTGQLFHDGGGEGRLDVLTRLVRDESAQDLLEYTLLAAFIGIAGWAVLMTLPNVMGATYASWLDTTNGVPGQWDHGAGFCRFIVAEWTTRFFPRVEMVMTSENIPIWAVLVVAALAVGFDVRTRRIPNLLTFGAAVLAVLFAVADNGYPG